MPYSTRWTFDLPFRGFLITHIQRDTLELLWTSDQPVAENSTYTVQHNRQTSMPREGFETATAAKKRPQTYALDRGHWDRHIASNRKDITKWQIRKHSEESSRSFKTLFWHSSWGTEVSHETFNQDCRLWAEIVTQDLPNWKQKC
jgi:hypothetical protein